MTLSKLSCGGQKNSILVTQQWNKVTDRNDMPMDGRVFIALWKGAVCFVQYDKDDNRFWYCHHPADYETAPCSSEREHKFTHWMELPPLPEDAAPVD